MALPCSLPAVEYSDDPLGTERLPLDGPLLDRVLMFRFIGSSDGWSFRDGTLIRGSDLLLLRSEFGVEMSAKGLRNSIELLVPCCGCFARELRAFGMRILASRKRSIVMRNSRFPFTYATATHLRVPAYCLLVQWYVRGRYYQKTRIISGRYLSNKRVVLHLR